MSPVRACANTTGAGLGSDFERNLPTDLFDADLQSSSDLGLDAALHCEPCGCE